MNLKRFNQHISDCLIRQILLFAAAQKVNKKAAADNKKLKKHSFH